MKLFALFGWVVAIVLGLASVWPRDATRHVDAQVFREATQRGGGGSGITADEVGIVAGAKTRLIGVFVRESAGTAAVATVIFRRGDDATDPIIAPIELAPNESAWFGAEVFGPNGFRLDTAGLYIDHVAGTFDYVLFTE